MAVQLALRQPGELHTAGVKCLIIEARPRLGGRAWTVAGPSGFGLDLGCGWLHSADRNPWAVVAQEQNRTIDKTPPPWRRRSTVGFPEGEQHEFLEAQEQFSARVSEQAANEPDVAAASLLERGNRWNNLINAVGTYISGAELDQVSARDFDNYDDTGVNWRVVEGYGTTIAACGEGLPVALGCPVNRINHLEKRLSVETSQGVVAADQVIVTLPSAILAENEGLFAPALPEKTEAAYGLPLGLADKLFLSLTDAEEFEKDSRMFGAIDRTATATYHFRPFGRPQIEVYFGGQSGARTRGRRRRRVLRFFDFPADWSAWQCVQQTGQTHSNPPLGIRSVFARFVFICASRHGGLPYETAAPIDGRLFFAGEACSPHDFSTAHGGWITGVAAADQALSVRARA